MHYFDYNSTVPVTSDARTAWTNANAEHWFNPSSPYLQGSSVRIRLDEARASFASLLGCQPKGPYSILVLQKVTTQQLIIFQGLAKEANAY